MTDDSFDPFARRHRVRFRRQIDPLPPDLPLRDVIAALAGQHALRRDRTS